MSVPVNIYPCGKNLESNMLTQARSTPWWYLVLRHDWNVCNHCKYIYSSNAFKCIFWGILYFSSYMSHYLILLFHFRGKYYTFNFVTSVWQLELFATLQIKILHTKQIWSSHKVWHTRVVRVTLISISGDPLYNYSQQITWKVTFAGKYSAQLIIQLY